MKKSPSALAQARGAAPKKLREERNMKTLSHLRELAQVLNNRERVKIEITLASGRIISASYDPLFKTVTTGGATFPDRELNTWTKVLYGSETVRITSKNEKENPL